ncbi:hypothetical protein ACF0H5_023733 [Mactra antiquata]
MSWKHEKKCLNQTFNNTLPCAQCNKTFTSTQELLKHENVTKHNRPGGSTDSVSNSVKSNNQEINSKEVNQNKRVTCRKCGDSFNDRCDLYNHRTQHHTDHHSIQANPWDSNGDNAPWVNEDGSENENMRRVNNQHRHLILRERVREGEVKDTFSFPIPDL